jgi:hypothetical protein
MEMAYDRYDTRQGPRDDRSRWSDDRYQSRDRSRGGDDRGFFERAGEEISSWFGGGDHDERDYRDRERQRGSGSREVSRQDENSWLGRERDRDRARGSRGDDDDRGDGWFSKDSYRGYGGDRGGNYGRSPFMGTDGGRDERDYRPMTGDYGRSRAYGGSYRDEDRSFGRDRDHPQSNWDRDDYRRTSFAGSRERSNHHDPHYHEWRQRQIGELDRDYDDYRREHQQKFESDFGNWRQQRQSKRQMLSQIREHMEVVGSDDGHVGMVDKVAGDRVILTKSDPESGSVHHSISCHNIDRVEGDRVILDWIADQARKHWTDETRSRALFEPEDRGDMGAHALDRSFSGTYRD